MELVVAVFAWKEISREECSSSSRSPYKIFSNSNELEIYLQKNKGKICENMEPVFVSEKYREFKNTQVRKLTQNEIEKYIDEK